MQNKKKTFENTPNKSKKRLKINLSHAALHFKWIFISEKRNEDFKKGIELKRNKYAYNLALSLIIEIVEFEKKIELVTKSTM